MNIYNKVDYDFLITVSDSYNYTISLSQLTSNSNSQRGIDDRALDENERAVNSIPNCSCAPDQVIIPLKRYGSVRIQLKIDHGFFSIRVLGYFMFYSIFQAEELRNFWIGIGAIGGAFVILVILIIIIIIWYSPIILNFNVYKSKRHIYF